MNFEVGVNTYITVEEADSIVDNEFSTNDEEVKLWSTLSEKDKQRIILKGTRKTEDLTYLGKRLKSYQPMSWPRYINLREVICPYDVKVGLLKVGIRQVMNSTRDEVKLQGLGVKSYSIKGASITFGDKSVNDIVTGCLYEDIFNEHFIKWTY